MPQARWLLTRAFGAREKGIGDEQEDRGGDDGSGDDGSDLPSTGWVLVWPHRDSWNLVVELRPRSAPVRGAGHRLSPGGEVSVLGGLLWRLTLFLFSFRVDLARKLDIFYR